MKEIRKLMKELAVPPGKRVRLKRHDPAWTGSFQDETRAKTFLAEGVKKLSKQQNLLYAQDTYSVLLIFQAMDAAGKDGTIRHVLSGVNPQGCQVYSVQGPVRRRTGSRLPVANLKGVARAWADRDPQPVLL